MKRRKPWYFGKVTAPANINTVLPPGIPWGGEVLRAIVFLMMAVGINLPSPTPAGNMTIFKEIVMSSANKGRAWLTTKVPINSAIELAERAEALGVSRHRLIVRALLAGLDPAIEQIRAEQVTQAAQQQQQG